MNLEDIINALKRKSWLIVLITITCTGITIFINLYVVKPLFTTDRSIYLMTYNNRDTDKRITNDDVLVSKELTKNCIEMLEIDTLASETIDKLNIKDLNENELSKKINIKLKDDTNILQVSIKDTDGSRAIDLINSISNTIINKINDVYDKDNVDVKILDESKLPKVTVEQHKVRYTLLSFIASTLGSVCLVILLEFLDTTVKSVQDIEQELGYTVIGIIPEMNIK